MDVTYQLEFLDAADLVMVVEDCITVESGKYQDLILNHDGELIRQMVAHSHSLNQLSPPKHIGSGKSYCHNKQTELTQEKIVDMSRSSQVSDRNLHEETETSRVKWHVCSSFVTSHIEEILFQ